MRDIVQELEKAKREKPDYNFDIIEKGISVFESGEFTYDWDKGDEEWISLIRDRKRIAMIGVRIPVFFVIHEAKEAMRSFDFLKCLYWIEVDDFDEKIWSIELVEYNTRIGEPQFCASQDAFDFSAFSTNDFWYATIT